MIRIFKPQEAQKVSKFMESVQPNGTIVGHMRDTAVQIGKTTGAILTAPIAAASGVVEGASYLAANVSGVVPVGFNTLGKVASNTREKIKDVFGMAA